MPVHKQGSGYQWGSHGKVYTGKGAAAKAAKQGQAAYANGYQGHSKGTGSGGTKAKHKG